MTGGGKFDSQRTRGVRHHGEMAVDALPHPPDNDFELLTAGEAAELIRLPRSSLYELARNRRIPYVRIGRRIVVVRALVQWVIDEMSVPPRRREPRPPMTTRA